MLSRRVASGRIAWAAIAFGCALSAVSGRAGAQTWSWGSVSTPPYGPALQTQSSVALSRSTVTFSSVAPSGNRRIVLASCHAALRDVQSATAVHAQGQAFILIEFKPRRGADCDSGKKTIASLPSDNFAQAGEIAAAVNSACCSSAATRQTAHPAPIRRIAAATKTPRPSPVPAPTASPGPVRSPGPAPTRSPSPAPTQSPESAAIRLVDWTEKQGTLAFVRVYNVGRRPVTLADGVVLECGTLDIRCGSRPQRRTVRPRSIATIAVVASADQRALPPFSYRYTAASGTDTLSLQGSSAKSRPPRIWPLSRQESQSALAAAGIDLRAPASVAAAASAATTGAAPAPVARAGDGPPRLLTRGFSRLAIGHKGVALVRVFVTPDGTPQEASVISTNNPQLTAAAIETAASSTYAPAIRGGRPVGANYVATFSFDGEDPADAAVPVWKRAVPVWRRSPAATPPPATTVSPASPVHSSTPTTTSQTGS